MPVVLGRSRDYVSRARYPAGVTIATVDRDNATQVTLNLDFSGTDFDVTANVDVEIATAALATGVPVIFGILTTETVEQALNRAGLKAGNKGAESAMAAIEMVNLLARIRSGTVAGGDTGR